MKVSTVDTLIWVMFYGGLLTVGLGMSVLRSDDGLGYGLIVAGVVMAVAGFALLYVRSRMNEPPQPKDKTP